MTPEERARARQIVGMVCGDHRFEAEVAAAIREAQREAVRDMKSWALAANKFAWAHERSCPRHDADLPCSCGLDTFLARPRIAIEDTLREIRQEARDAAFRDLSAAIREVRIQIEQHGYQEGIAAKLDAAFIRALEGQQR